MDSVFGSGNYNLHNKLIHFQPANSNSTHARSFASFTFYKIFVTCCILSKSKQGRWGRCIRWLVCLICRRLGDTEQWNNFAGGLIDCTSNEIFGLSQEIFLFSRPRPQSLSMSGVFERYINVPRCGFNASIGGDVRKFTTGAGIFSKKLRTCVFGNKQKSTMEKKKMGSHCRCRYLLHHLNFVLLIAFDFLWWHKMWSTTMVI